MAGEGIGASGFVGIAIEGTPGVYTAPTKFFPLRTEGVNWTQGTAWRRVIRGTADVIGAVPGNGHVEGDLDIELLDDVLPYFLLCARGTVTKTGTDDPNTTTVENQAPFTYEFIPTHQAVPTRTMSVTIVRNGEVFAFTGCTVGTQAYSVDDSMAVVTMSMIGREESSEALPVPTYNPDDQPFGAGTWSIEIPTLTQVFDTDNWSLNIDDGAEAQNRLQTSRGAAFVKFGERSVTESVERDFKDRVEYDQFKNLTEKSLTTRLSQGTNRQVEFQVPTAIIDTYELGLSGVGDLVRGSITYQGVHDPSISGGYRIEVVTDEDITV